jgi:hypothetical protein
MIDVLSVPCKLTVQSDHERQAKPAGGTQSVQRVATHAVNVNDGRSMKKELTINLPLDQATFKRVRQHESWCRLR